MASQDDEQVPKTLFACALDVLRTGDGFAKADKSSKYAALWKSGAIEEIVSVEDETDAVPDHPARPGNVVVVAPQKVKQGSRKAFVHGLAHAESYAIDLMWDMVARFVDQQLPREFYDDWVRIADEESQHFHAWAHRLTELGSFYGDLPGHDGLWDSAHETRGDILTRMAIVHLVHEARGLDVAPNAVARFEKADDQISLKILSKNYREEQTHVGAGVKWFRYVCEREGEDPIKKFQEIVPKHFQGKLKPPFNKEARDAAGLYEEWYLPLSSLAAPLSKEDATAPAVTDSAVAADATAA